MTYPDGEALTYSYQDNLLLDGVQSSIDSLNLVSSVSYKDIGLPDSYTLGSSPTTATQSFEYWKIDDSSRSPYGALKRTKLTKDSTDLVNREMQYDPVGNVTKIVDGVNSETIDYTYDELDRLLTASVPSGESFVYNTIGNMTSKSGATLDYGTTSPKHGVKTYGSASYTYDANGSMTAKGDLSIKYDPERRPVRVQDSGTIYRVVYDGDGVRRKRLDENGTIHYLGDYERNVGNGSDTTEVVTKYYYATLGAMTRLIAFRRGGTLHWVGSDHLGGTIRVMDSSFAAVDGMRYEPYGEDRDSGDSLNTDRKFTGQTEDEAVGLYWYASRAYDPDTGRFCAPDPIVPAPGNPQSLNRYSYVYNNPLKYVDPSGHSAEWVNQKWVEDFIGDHGHEPTGLDIAYRYESMQAASQGQDFSVEYWAGQIEQAASNIAGSVGGALLDAVILRSQIYAAVIDTTVPTLIHGFDYQEWNAVAHAYWSGMLTIVHGPAMAEEITERHERMGMERGQPIVERAMDRFNNKVGRDIALGLSPRQRNNRGSRYEGAALLEKVLEAEREGILMKIVNGELKPTSPVNYALPLDAVASPDQFR